MMKGCSMVNDELRTDRDLNVSKMGRFNNRNGQ
jgi:hypothetical protein